MGATKKVPRRAQLTTPRMMLASGMSETEAIEGAKQGDGECFEFLYNLHKKRVYSLCLRMIRDVDVAEDLAQEAFLQLYRKIPTFSRRFRVLPPGCTASRSTLSSCAYVSAYFRKCTSRTHRSPTEDGGPRKDYGSEDRVLAGSIDRVILKRVIENLAPGYRIIFVLHDVEGYEHNEIAEMLGCSLGTSKSQLHKARLVLRNQLNITRAENSRRPALRKMKTKREATAPTIRGSKLRPPPPRPQEQQLRMPSARDCEQT